MRLGSERVPNKNTRRFADVDGGLCELKLRQLLSSRLINDIIISTNDPEVTAISRKFNSDKIKIIQRPDELALSSTSTDDLIKYVPSIMSKAHILWTHVTSPFISAKIYDDMIDAYFYNIETHDSLMTVTKLQKFIWDEAKPINYDRDIEKWPRTQTLESLWEVNSGAFITRHEIYTEKFDRIGEKPYLFELDELISCDIDWFSNFNFAEAIYKSCLPKYE